MKGERNASLRTPRTEVLEGNPNFLWELLSLMEKALKKKKKKDSGS